MVEKLTPAQRRALEAVQAGLCYRKYHATGNVLLGPKGVGAASLWVLDRKKLIADAREPSNRCRLVLTKLGAEMIPPKAIIKEIEGD